MRHAHCWGAALAALLACSSQKKQEPAAPAPPRSPPSVSAPFDLGAVIQQVHFAFREEGGEFRAGHRTHTLSAGRDGRVTVTPWAPATAERDCALAQRRDGQPAPMLCSPGRGHPLSLRTVGAGTARVEVEETGALAVRRRPVADTAPAPVEHLANTARGLHQSWSFARAPQGRGDLVVRVAASGAAFQGETASGLHFRDPGSPAGVRYGHAVWVDAEGERTEVKARFASGPGEIVLRVPAEVVARSRFPAVLDPYVSPEIGTDAPLEVEASGDQSNARTATTGSNYLVVWDDYRDPGTGFDILGARVSTTGTPLDPRGFIICNAPGDQVHPAVADDDNTQYFVVWQDGRNAATTFWDIYGAVVPSSGLAAPVSGIPLVTNPGNQVEPAIAFDSVTGANSAFLAAWSDDRAGAPDIFGAHLERDGGIRESGGFAVSNAIDVQDSPAVAHDGAEFVVAWRDVRANPVANIYARRVSSTGATLFPEAQITQGSSQPVQPTVAGGAGFALVAWTDARTASDDIYGQLLSGGALQGGNFAVSDAGFNQYEPSAAFDGTRFDVAWTDERNTGARAVYGTAVTTTGTLVYPAGISLASPGRLPALSTGTASPLLAFTDDTLLGGADVYGSVLGGFGSPGPRVLLSRSANTQGNPAAGFDGTNYLVVWEDNRTAADSSTDLWGARVSAQGQVLDPAGIAISTEKKEQRRPAVAGGDGGWAVAWEDYRDGEPVQTCNRFFCITCYVAGDIFGTLVQADGGVVSPSGMPISDAGAAQVEPAVSFDGQNYFIAWGDDRNSPGFCFPQGFGGLNPTDLYGQWMTPQGAVLGTPAGDYLSTDDKGVREVQIATLGDRHVVSWRNQGDARIEQPNMGGAVTVLSLDGGTLSPPQTLASLSARGFGVAADPFRFWAVWEEDQADGGMDVLLQPVEPSGDAGAVTVIAGTDALEGQPALVYDGRELLLAFHADFDGGEQVGVFVEWLGPNGLPLPPPFPVPVNVSAGSSGALRATGDGRGRALVTYQKYDPSPQYKAQRVRSNLVQKGNPNGSSCLNPDECFSGFCIDDVCCESDCGGGSIGGACRACNPIYGSTGARGECRPRAQGSVCTPGSGCVDDARCDGVSITCPAPGARPSGTVCRPAVTPCDAEETCDGQGRTCPEDKSEPDGTSCGDLMACKAAQCAPVTPASLYDSCANCSAGGTALALPLAFLLHLLARRKRRRVDGRWMVVVVAAGLLVPGQARAAEKARPRLAFLGITGTAGVSQEIASSFSEYLQSETTALDVYSVIGMGEIRQMLGLERQKQLAGCTKESSCVAEMVGALDADRAIFGDVSRLGDSMVLNISLMDLKRGKLLGRVGKRVPGSTVEPLLENARAILYELVRSDPALEGRELVLEKRFGGLRVGLRADADVAGPAVAPGLSADVSTHLFGGGLTLLYGNGLGIRAEGRVYPLELARVRPYAGAGATVFIPSVGPVVGLRGVAGAEVLVGSFTISADVAYERFLTDSQLFLHNSVLIGAGMGYLF